MKGSHVHVKVKDFPAALQWLGEVWGLKPAFQNDRMAVIPLGAFSMIVDASEEDTEATIAFESQDCGKDFRSVVERGAQVIEPPTQQPWGVIAAYLKGPGGLSFEIEQALASGR